MELFQFILVCCIVFLIMWVLCACPTNANLMMSRLDGLGEGLSRLEHDPKFMDLLFQCVPPETRMYYQMYQRFFPAQEEEEGFGIPRAKLRAMPLDYRKTLLRFLKERKCGTCPITFEEMQDPRTGFVRGYGVTALFRNTGAHVTLFDSTALQLWFSGGRRTDPITNLRIHDFDRSIYVLST